MGTTIREVLNHFDMPDPGISYRAARTAVFRELLRRDIMFAIRRRNALNSDLHWGTRTLGGGLRLCGGLGTHAAGCTGMLVSYGIRC